MIAIMILCLISFFIIYEFLKYFFFVVFGLICHCIRSISTCICTIYYKIVILLIIKAFFLYAELYKVKLYNFISIVRLSFIALLSCTTILHLIPRKVFFFSGAESNNQLIHLILSLGIETIFFV